MAEHERRSIDQLKVTLAQRKAGRDKHALTVTNKPSALAISGIAFLLAAIPGIVVVTLGVPMPLGARAAYVILVALPAFGTFMAQLFRRIFGQRAYDFPSPNPGGVFIFIFVVIVSALSIAVARWLGVL